MDKRMEQKIIDDLIFRLNELYPEINSYDKKMVTDVEPPMFVISTYDSSRRSHIEGWFFYTYFFKVLFYPGNDSPEEAYRDIELELQQVVEHFGDGFRGDDINVKKIDGVLQLFFSITVQLRPDEPKPAEIKNLNTKVNKDGRQIFEGTVKDVS